MRIGILGCGALGLLWGARMLKAGHETVLITRTEKQKETLLQQGLIFTSLTKEKEQIPAQVESIKQISRQASFDVVFVTVKQTNLPEAIPVIQMITHPASQILFWQNGLGHEQQIERLQSRPWTYAAVTTEGAWKKGMNEVQHTGAGETQVGLFPRTGRDSHIHFRSFLHDLTHIPNRAAFSIQYEPHIRKRMWEKLLVNCVINPLTGLYEVKNGELLSGKYTSIMEQILKEALAVASSQGMVFAYAEMMAKIRSVCERTADNYSSLLQDLQKGVPTEIEFINGVVVKTGRQAHVDTPVNRRLVELIRAKEARKMATSFETEDGMV
ncbi:ketopantoate reductase family protein [Lihuaxuella thermophila]|uniref:2-dehydropantoate 2-reductase n=1 Tax=Lihuaxuella thermophila TaxID=1173111 RepID=A0A1H8DN96_9BACL|nr:2-dehydropantoate 2-reductase [Lihuaxuella thermophila]SEN08294.1 2-dehydropantoate 2-reductase [Lihuaxuella thermophila]